MKSKTLKSSSSSNYITLKIQLQSTEIMRTIIVPDYMTLCDLHTAIQSVMGWGDEHLWHFTDKTRDGIIYELPHDDQFAFSKQLRIDASKFTLKKAFPARGSKLFYEYDFGDGWFHVVTRMTDPKKPEIACVKTSGPNGIEDFGGQWRLWDFIAAMKVNSKDKKYEEQRDWCGFNTEKKLAKYLEGESLEVKTKNLRKALVHIEEKVVLPPVEITENDKANTLGFLFASSVSSSIWKILSKAMADGGECEFEDRDREIESFFLTQFEGLKVKCGWSTLSVVEPSKLTVPQEWVELYKLHGEKWEKLHEQFDIIESYATACVSLYGLLSKAELFEIIIHYDPACNLTCEEMCKLLDTRAISSPGIAYRFEGELLVADDKFPPEMDDVDQLIKDVREEQLNYPRWMPENRQELFLWENINAFPISTYANEIRKMIYSMFPNEIFLDHALYAMYSFLSMSADAVEICDLLKRRAFFKVPSGKKKLALIELMEKWRLVIHSPYLNGNTLEWLKSRQQVVKRN